MSEYLPDESTSSSHHSHRKHSTATPLITARPPRSESTVDSSGHTAARQRRQSAYPTYSRPPSSATTRRRQHSIAYTAHRSTMSDGRLVESAYPSCNSRQFCPPQSSMQYSQTEVIADQVAVHAVGNHISSRSLDVVDELTGSPRRCAGGLVFSGSGSRPSTTPANSSRLLSPFDELGEPSPTSLSRSSTSRADSSSSPAPQHNGSSSNVDKTLAAVDSHPPTVVLHVSASTRADLADIRAMLAAYMKRLSDKDAMNSVTKEWRIVAKVFDRLFFFLYCATIIISLSTIFPRA